jgi:hypothetical protein
MTVSLAGEALADAAGDTGTNAPEPFPKTIVYVEKQPAVRQTVPVSSAPRAYGLRAGVNF